MHWSHAQNRPIRGGGWTELTDAQVVKAARRLVEREGRDGFSKNDVAASVGIRAPSLYGRFKDRASLLGAVELQVCAELTVLLGKAVIANDSFRILTIALTSCHGCC